MVLKRKLTEEEFQRLLERIHRALAFGDYRLVAELLVEHGVTLTDQELAAWINMGGVWREVA